MEAFLHQLPHVGVVIVLLMGGMGFPLPEDIPLLVGGYLCHLGHANIYVMVPICYAAVLGGDFMMFALGRRYGKQVSKLPLLRRFLTPERLEKAVGAFEKYGGNALFVGRFLPGLRAGVFFSAGAFRVPAWKMLVFDGSAALISVPTLILVAYYGGDQIDRVRDIVADAQLVFFLLLVVVVSTIVWIRKRMERSSAETS
jgi:membrane protein DedA with SNARE-associated domain